MSEKTSNTKMVAVISFLVQYLGKECRSESHDPAEKLKASES